MTQQNSIVIHSKREDPFRRVPADIADSEKLTYQARGLITYLIGKPVGWKIRFWDLVRRSPHGRSFVRATVNELRMHGYMKLDARRRNARGEFEGGDYLLSDEPIWIDDPVNVALREKYVRKCAALSRSKKFVPTDEKLDADTPYTEKRYADVQDTVDRTLNKKESYKEGVLERKKSKTEERKSSIRPASPSDLEATFAPAALASIEALQKAIPDTTDGELKEPLNSVATLQFLRYWMENYKPVFSQAIKQFAVSEIKAAHKLVTDSGMDHKELWAVILTAWLKPVASDPKAPNPYWCCNRYSRSLTELVKISRGQSQSNFQRILAEIGWRGTAKQMKEAKEGLDQVIAYRARIAQDGI